MTDTLFYLVSEIIGVYEPYVSTLSDGSEVVSPNYGWILSCILFIVVIWSVFRFLGRLICNQ